MVQAGYTEDADMFGQALDELPPGTPLLHGQYTIARFINSGGFGITYLAKDSLDRDVVIKECYVDAFCRRTRTIVSARSRAHQNEMKSIIRHFIQEARSLSKLRHPNIVGVHQVFEDNDTAYMAIDFVNGRDLADIIDDPATSLPPGQVVMMTRKLLSAVGYVHEHGLLHRDISPDNILLNADGEPVLIDFGAAREHVPESGRKHSALRVVKDGYSPQEFYIAGSEQGPWSDLYALAATLYHLIKGEAPVNGQERLAAIADQRPDPYAPLAGKVEGYPAGFLEAIDQAMNTKPSRRLQSAGEWLDMIDGKAAPATEKAVAFAPLMDHEELAAAPAQGKGRGKLAGILAVAAVAVAGGVGYVMLGSGDVPPVPGQNAKVVAVAPAAPAPKPASTTPAVVPAATEPPAVPTPAAVAVPAEPKAAASAPVSTPETAPASAAKTEAAAPSVPTAVPELAATPVALPAETPAPSVPVVAVEPTPVPAAEPAPPKAPEAVAETAPVASLPAPPLGPVLEQQITLALWDIALPFDYVETTEDSTTVAMISTVHSGVDQAVVGGWLAEGVEIDAVNGTPLSLEEPLSTQILNAMKIDPDGYTRVGVRFRAPGAAMPELGLLAVPVVQRLGLADGTMLEARRDGAETALVVTDAAPSETGLRTGDVLLSEADTGILIEGSEALEEVLNSLVAKNIGAARFEVTRDGATAIATYALARRG
jgi:hypothetical protein